MNNVMAEIKIPLPPLEIQQQIVNACEEVEAQNHALDRAIADQHDTISAILSYTKITDADIHQNFNQKNTAFFHSLPTPETYWLSEWKSEKLGNICEINEKTYNPSHDTKEFIYIDIDSVEKGTGKINIPPRQRGDSLPTRARRLADDDSVIISSVRPYLKGFAYIQQKIDNSIFSTGFIILKGKETIIKSKLIYILFMYNTNLMQQMEHKMQKASYPSINQDDVQNFKIPLPPLEAQEKIVSAIEACEKEILRLENEKESLHGKTDAILKQYLF